MLHILWLSYLPVAAVCVGRIVGARLAPPTAAAWILAVVCLPWAGAALYLLTAWFRVPPTRRPPGRLPFVESVVAGGCGSRADARNRVELLNDGGDTFSALIAALHRARRTIHLEYYIFDDDRIGCAIADVLLRKTRAGVTVRLLYDAVGSPLPSRGMLRRLREGGVDVRAFEPWRFPWLRPSFNVRNHRKIAVIDGRTAFLGGINIARRYLEGNGLGRWRDEHLRIEGRAVADLQRLFAADWARAGGAAFDADGTLAPVDILHGVRVQIGWAQTGSTRRTLHDAFVAAVMQARREVRIATPYFVPPCALRHVLCIASAGGVRVRLMVPARADSRIAALAGESYFGELLDAGVEIYLYDNGFLHSKTLVVDESMASVGTANLDCRSLFINWEVAAFVHDGRFARRAAEIFDRDIARCRRLTADEYASRPPLHRAAASCARLLAEEL